MEVIDFRVNVVERVVETIREMAKTTEHGSKTIDVDARYASLMASDLYFEDFMTDFFEYDDFSDFGRGRSVLNFSDRWFGIVYDWSSSVLTISSFADADGAIEFIGEP